MTTESVDPALYQQREVANRVINNSLQQHHITYI